MVETETPALTPRQSKILAAVCRDYAVTGVDVSSQRLAGAHDLAWSSATIRQELATLERFGYLSRSHHAAGRRPTAAGMQRYVTTLSVAARPSPAVMRAVDRGLSDLGDDPEGGMRAAVCILNEVSGCLAVSFLGSARGGALEGLDVVPLVAGRVLVVVKMDTGATGIVPVTLHAGPWSDDHDPGVELRRLQERLRWLCVGRTLAQARQELLRLLSEQEARFDALLAEALRVGLSVCAAVGFDPLWVQVAGQATLARDGLTPQAIEEALALLEDYHRLAEVLCQLIPAPHASSDPRVEVRVGAVEPTVPGPSPPAGLTLVGCRVPPLSTGSKGPSTGAVALLGSDRMDYAAVIPLVEYAARALAARTCD